MGTHYETTRKRDKEEKVTVTDFDVRLDMTHLLVPGPNTPASLIRQDFEIPLPQTKAYPDADSYIHSYTSSRYPVRSFTLNRRIPVSRLRSP